ncbi:P-loop containing nucleoside triphosphate hydrolase protein, partial [Aureobasidium melanogenum]
TPDRNLGARLERICESAISELRRLELIEQGLSFKCTEYGDAMARYYMNITTMELILSLPRKPKISEILTIISQAHEFREIRFRSGEKLPYKELNGKNDIRFPFKIDLSAAAHKVSLIIQAVLGRVEHIAEQSNHRVQYSIDQSLIFQHVHRLIRCIVDCQNIDKDAVGIRNSLMLSRSLAARVWDDSPMVLQQIEQVGPVAVRKLVDAGITTMDGFSSTDPGRLELVLNKAPPFGMKMHRQVQTFPKLRISLKMSGQPVINHEHVAVKLKIDFGFLNDKTPIHYRNKPVFVIVLLGTSDGYRIDFFRLSAAKLQNINPITKTAYLTSPIQLIECFAACDDLAGTMQEAVLKPDIPLSAFQSIEDTTADVGRNNQATGPVDSVKSTLTRLQRSTDADEWDDGALNDDDFIGAEPKEDDFMDVDALDQPMFSLAKNGKSKNKTTIVDTVKALNEQRLENGNYACNHRCKDRKACKHKCCKEGLEKKPKPKKPKDGESSNTASKSKTTSTSSTKVQSKLELPIRRKVVSQPVEHLDLSQASASSKARVPTAATRLASLHSSTTRSNRIPTLGATSVMPMSPASSGHVARPRFYQSQNFLRSVEEETYNDSPSMESIVEVSGDADDDDKILSEEEDYLDKDEEMLDAALVGLEDSQNLQTLDEIIGSTQSPDMLDFGANYQENSDEPTLFVTPHPQRIDDFTGEFEDAVAIFDQNMDDDDSTLPAMVKRKRDEGVSSVYFSAKKARTDNDMELQSFEEQAQEEKGDEESVEDKEKREEEELRAWLAAELGDSVEMI